MGIALDRIIVIKLAQFHRLAAVFEMRFESREKNRSLFLHNLMRLWHNTTFYHTLEFEKRREKIVLVALLCIAPEIPQALLERPLPENNLNP